MGLCEVFYIIKSYRIVYKEVLRLMLTNKAILLI